MKLSTLNRKLSLGSVATNSKTIKSDTLFTDTATFIMYLSPSTLGGRGDVCRHKSSSCEKFCLGPYSGRGVFNNVRLARERKTKLFFDDNQKFKELLNNDMELFKKYCEEHSLQGYVRLNGSSDIDFMKIKYKEDSLNIFQKHPDLYFYDYTKDFKRKSNLKNYKITYSYSENTTEDQMKSILDNSLNLAVVFDKLPENWKNYKVINGDETDLRFKDPLGVIIGLTPKGNLLKKAVKNNEDGGFVVKPFEIPMKELL